MKDASDQPVRSCRVHVQAVDGDVSLAALSRVVARQKYPAILGANESVRGRSIFCAEPVERFTFHTNQTNPFDKLKTALRRYQIRSYQLKGSDPFNSKDDPKTAPDPFFFGGWIGYFAYDLGPYIERMPEQSVQDLPLPVIDLAFYDKAIVYDHAEKQFYLIAVEIEGEDGTIDQKFRVLNQWIIEAENLKENPFPAGDFQQSEVTLPDCNMTERQYYEALEKIKRYIYDGDVYQINFSQRFSMPFEGDPVDLFCWQNEHNPSPYSAYLQLDEGAIVSASPELFLQITGDHICTRPIKGTRPRVQGLHAESINQANRADLIESEKDQAELAMIVDLERNDLARICIPGSRHVSCLREIETFPSVYHAVSTIEGTLSDRTSPDLVEKILRAVFPGGSITGAPKIRAMEIIDELEPTARSVYTGSIGWIGLNFDMQLNIAIRTIIVFKKRAYVQVGGGIVADSDPLAEWNETLTKARALLDGIRSIQISKRRNY